MLDRQYIRDNLDAVNTNCKNRNVTADVDQVVALDDERKRIISALQLKQLSRRYTKVREALDRT